MATWNRNAAGNLVKREIVGWGRNMASVVVGADGRRVHAIEKVNGWEQVAACGENVAGLSSISAKEHAALKSGERCRKCEGIALDLIGIKAVA